MSLQILNYDLKKYQKSCKNVGEPISINDPTITHYDFRKISDYAKNKGVKPHELGKEEIEKFAIKKTG